MAETKIFTNTYDSTKSYSVAGALVTWGTNGSTSQNFPLYMTNLRWSFGRNVNPIEPINVGEDGSFRQLNLVGTAMGGITIGAVMVPEASSLAAFLDAAGKGCIDDSEQITIAIKPFHKGCTNISLTYQLDGFVLSSLSQTLSGGQMAKDLQGNFTRMKIIY